MKIDAEAVVSLRGERLVEFVPDLPPPITQTALAHSDPLPSTLSPRLSARPEAISFLHSS